MAEPDKSSGAEPKKRRATGNKEIGARIAKAREALNLGQEELGRQLGGVSKAGVSQWESGATAINPKHVHALSLILGIPARELMDLPPGAEFLTTEERWLIDRFRKLDPKIRESLLVFLGGPPGAD